MTRSLAEPSKALALAMTGLLALACGKPSDEALIRDLLKRTAARAEKGDTAGMMEAFAPDYVDFEGRDGEGTLRLVAGYLGRYRRVVIHLLGTRVGPVGPDGRASLECEVSLSHGAAEALRKIIRYAGEFYRFRIELGKTGPGEWRFTYAEWEPVGPAGLFPESLDVLRELFPGS
ncbi:MAG: hypothetical protein JW775_11830 [Candidatus Aminicenantes bacterium]|nr:hypothetical protein [Candidatus Aminicenantes bacterium]